MSAKAPEDEILAHFRRWPSTIDVRRGQWSRATAAVERDPDMDCVSLVTAPRDDEDVEALRACLRRAPHVVRVCWPKAVERETGGLERWLPAVRELFFEHLGALSDTFAQTLAATPMRRMHVGHTHSALVAAVEGNESLEQLNYFFWDSGESTEIAELGARILLCGARLPCFKIWLSSGFPSADALAAFAARAQKTSALSSLEIGRLNVEATGEERLGFAPLWQALSAAPCRAMRSISLHGFPAAGIESLLATAYAHDCLEHLELHACERAALPLLLVPIMTNCVSLITLALSFQGLSGGNRNAFEEATLAISDQGSTCSTLLSSLTFAVPNSAKEEPLCAEEGALVHIFLARMITANKCLITARVLDVNCWTLLLSRSALPSMLSAVRNLSLDLNGLEASSGLIEALLLKANIEKLYLLQVSGSLLAEIARCLKTAWPSHLEHLNVNMRSGDRVSETTFVQLCDALHESALVGFTLREQQVDDDESSESESDAEDDEQTVTRKRASKARKTAAAAALASDACRLAVGRLLWRAPTLRLLQIEVGVVLLPARTLRDAIWAHDLLEATNLLDDDDVGDFDTDKLLDARRLRRHRLAAHWAQAALSIAFGRTQSAALRGAVAPFLEPTLALAGLMLPQESWARRLARSAFFKASCASLNRSIPDASRKRKRFPT